MRGISPCSRSMFGWRRLARMMVVVSVGLMLTLGCVSAAFGAPVVVGWVTLPVQPYGVAVNEITNRVYTANLTAASVNIIDGATGTITGMLGVGAGPFDVAVNRIANRAYVTCYGSNYVAVIDGATGMAVGNVAVGSGPQGVAVNEATNRVYVANSTANSVSVIDGATGSVIGAPIPVGPHPIGVAVNQVTNRVYVANSGAGTVSIIDGATGTVASVIGVGAYPSCVAANTATNRAYVTNSGAGTVSVIDGASGALVGGPITVGVQPIGVEVDESANRIYVTDIGVGNLSVIDGATGAVLGAASVVGNFRDVAVNETTHRIYLPQANSNVVLVLQEPASTTTTLSSSKNPSTVGDAVTFTAQVVPSSATGHVTYYDGATALGTANVYGGTSTFQIAALPVGSHPITATFTGVGAYSGSTSSQVDQLVQAQPPASGGSVLWWQQLAPRPVAAQAAAGGEVGGSVYVIGGKTQPGTTRIMGGELTRVDRYDIATNTWASNIANTAPARAGGANVTKGQYIYMAGGANGTTLMTDISYFDTWTLSTHHIGDLQTARSGGRGCLVGDTFFIVGGFDASGNALSSIEAFVIDPAGTSGTALGTVATMGVPRWHAGVWTKNGDLYVAGGYTTGTVPTNSVLRITPTGTPPYTPVNLAPLPSARTLPKGFELADGRVYFASADTANDVCSYDLNTGWRLEGSMPTPRLGPTVYGVGGTRMYSIGGAYGTAVFNDNNVAILLNVMGQGTTSVSGGGSYTATVQGQQIGVEFPPGVGSGGLTVSQVNPNGAPVGVPTGFMVDNSPNGSPNGAIYEIMTDVDFAPGQLKITLPYSGSQQNATIYHWDGSTWVAVAGPFTFGNGTVSFYTSTLSPFAVFGDAAPTAPTEVVSASSVWSLALMALFSVGIALVANRRSAAGTN